MESAKPQALQPLETPVRPPHLFVSSPDATTIPWIDSPFFPQLLKTRGLDPETEALVRHFAEHGYVIIDPELPGEVLDGAIRDLEGRFMTSPSAGYYADETRLQDGWNFSENIRQIATAEKVLRLLQILYGREPVPFQTINFRVDSQQRTHSDTIHFDSIPEGFMCGVWTALEDIDTTNGPLHYYPRSQKLPVYSLEHLGITASDQSHPYDHYFSVYENFVEALMTGTELDRAELHVERGQALIWSSNLFHGGTPILDTSRTRWSQVTHYYFNDCIYYRPLLSDLAIGKMSIVPAWNIVTKTRAVQSYNGKAIANPGNWPPVFVGEEVAAAGAAARRLDEEQVGMIDRIVRRLRLR